MENSNSYSSKHQKNRNRMVLEGGVVGLGIVAAMSVTNINNSTSTHTDIVSSAKAAANFRGTTTSGLFFASTLNKTGTSFVSPTSYFLNSCNLCNKNLHGVDIFMYRGEWAFCSAECRETHIRNDDYHEKRSKSDVMQPLDCSAAPCCSSRPLSLAGIAAA